jgi:hypothetical protein
VRIRWPDGRSFAFTIFDDTDKTTVENGRPVYDLLTGLDLRITKSVWPLAPWGPPRTGGSTCAEPDYLAWVLELQAAGHEIGFHNATDHSSRRSQTIEGLDRFRELFGADPRVGADHSGNEEAVYWGPDRLSGARAWAYSRAMRLSRPDRLAPQGHLPDSEFFCADVLRDRVDYWRNFTFARTDTLAACPPMPYHDPKRPYVNWWFASSHAPTPLPFYELLAPGRLDQLEADGGLCVVYTHFGTGFADGGTVDPRLRAVLEDLARRDGWFVPVSTALDHVRAERRSEAPLTDAERRRMELRWITDQTRGRGVGEVRRAARRLRGGHRG